MALTDKQQAFVREYLIDFNGTQAAIRAGYSEKTAKSQASQLLTNEDVSEALKKGVEDLDNKADLTKLNLLERLQSIMELTGYSEEHCQKAIKAIEVYAKMCGMNEPEKVEHSGDGIIINYNKPKK